MGGSPVLFRNSSTACARCAGSGMRVVNAESRNWVTLAPAGIENEVGVVVSPRDALALNAEFGRRWLAMNWYEEPKNRSSQYPPTCVRSFGFH